jgi:hypothetical protein
VLHAFSGNFAPVSTVRAELLQPYLHPVLDSILAGINANDPDAFSALVRIAQPYGADREHQNARPLLYYAKFCALRQPGLSKFRSPFITRWLAYDSSTPRGLARADLTCTWFLLELLIKACVLDAPTGPEELSSVTRAITRNIIALRGKGLDLALNVNKYLCYFFKDLVEICRPSWTVLIVRRNIQGLNMAVNELDRQCLTQYFQYFLSPKVFLILLTPLDASLPFDALFSIATQAIMSDGQRASVLFHRLELLIEQFSSDQWPMIANKLVGLIYIISKAGPILALYPSKIYLKHIIAVGHFILYYASFPEFDERLATATVALLNASRRINFDGVQEDRRGTGIASSASAAATGRAGVRSRGLTYTAKMPARNVSLVSRESLSLDDESPADTVADFARMCFCVQTVMIALIRKHTGVHVLNGIIAPMCHQDIAPLLRPAFASAVRESLEREGAVIFSDPSSKVKDIVKWMLKDINAENAGAIERLVEIEAANFPSINRMTALITRALGNGELAKRIAPFLPPRFGDRPAKILAVNERLSSTELKTGNPEVYADLLLEKAELLAPSPDARVAVLLQLVAYHTERRYYSEAVIAQLTAAALVAEYLQRLGRIPHYFPGDSAARCLATACPSAVSEECPASILADFPTIGGFCGSKQFSEYGLIFLIRTAIDACKRGQLYELSTKIRAILSPIAEQRGLWYVMKLQFETGKFAWQVIAKMSSVDDRTLGSYYRVQFQDKGNFIYRETRITNLWEFLNGVKLSAAYYANGRAVEVVNEGEELDSTALDPEKYYVHVKAVTQYFTPAERDHRVTVFEQNHNVSAFYFDVPVSKSAQASIEHCFLRRTVFQLPHPMPYIVKRVEVPPDHISRVMFTPIQNSCQQLQGQVTKIREALARAEYGKLQMLMQGSLLVQVNEGPKKMAEVFLSGGDDEAKDAVEYRVELRKTYREFLAALADAVVLHSQYAKKMPVWTALQENLEAGLLTLTSALQPYLS